MQDSKKCFSIRVWMGYQFSWLISEDCTIPCDSGSKSRYSSTLASAQCRCLITGLKLETHTPLIAAIFNDNESVVGTDEDQLMIVLCYYSK